MIIPSMHFYELRIVLDLRKMTHSYSLVRKDSPDILATEFDKRGLTHSLNVSVFFTDLC